MKLTQKGAPFRLILGLEYTETQHLPACRSGKSSLSPSRPLASKRPVPNGNQ